MQDALWRPPSEQTGKENGGGGTRANLHQLRLCWQSVVALLGEPVVVVNHFITLLEGPSSTGAATSEDMQQGDIVSDRDREVKEKQHAAASSHLKSYIHPLKVSLITTLASLLVISPPLLALFPYGLWGSVVVILIRQDSTASSFHKGYQRVEGTLLGCLFAFSMSRLFHCTDTDANTEAPCAEKNPVLLLSLLLVWIGFCSFFREHAQHGYAALVAGFTPIVVGEFSPLIRTPLMSECVSSSNNPAYVSAVALALLIC